MSTEAWVAIGTVIAGGGLLWRIQNALRNDIAGVNKDLAEANKDIGEVKGKLAAVGKDVEWLVWFFKTERGEK